MRLSDTPWTDTADHLKTAQVALLPVGATEAHGPHLPLTTDVIIAEGMAAAGALALAEVGIASIVLPALPYGVTYVGSVFPGTVGISPGALAAVLADIVRTTGRQGIRCMCAASAHFEPAHLETLTRAAVSVEWESGIRCLVLDLREERWAARLSEEFRRGARHAGSYETSLIMALRPDLVREDRRRALEPVWIDLPAQLRAGARTFKDAGSPLAYFGDPARATKEEGEAMLHALGGIIRDLVMETLSR